MKNISFLFSDSDTQRPEKSTTVILATQCESSPDTAMETNEKQHKKLKKQGYSIVRQNYKEIS